MIETPKIDKRSYEDLAAQMESLIPAFLPEWKPGEGDVGLALIHIFAHMVQEVSVSTQSADEGKLLIKIDYKVRTTNNRFNLVYPSYLSEGK